VWGRPGDVVDVLAVEDVSHDGEDVFFTNGGVGGAAEAGDVFDGDDEDGVTRPVEDERGLGGFGVYVP